MTFLTVHFVQYNATKNLFVGMHVQLTVHVQVFSANCYQKEEKNCTNKSTEALTIRLGTKWSS